MALTQEGLVPRPVAYGAAVNVQCAYCHNVKDKNEFITVRDETNWFPIHDQDIVTEIVQTFQVDMELPTPHMQTSPTAGIAISYRMEKSTQPISLCLLCYATVLNRLWPDVFAPPAPTPPVQAEDMTTL